jgi:radical SAM superfamily enzyme YgiQ (UPF0313 family)
MDVIFVSKDVLNWGHLNINLGIKYLSGILKKHGHNVEIIEAVHERVAEKLKSKKFCVIGYSVLERYAAYYCELNKKLKERFEFLSVFGGIYPTMKPEIIKEKGVDVVCIGEGEHPILELVSNLNCGAQVTGIRNLWIKQNGKIFKNAPRPPIDDLDSLPFPDRTLDYRNLASNITSAISSRGCTCSCAYCCSSSKLYQNKFRRRSVNNVIDELVQIKELPKYKFLKIIRFEDSAFDNSSIWLKDFSYKYRKIISIPFYCNVHVNNITKEKAGYLRHAGCYSVTLGIETADDCLRKSVLNRYMSKEKIINAIELLKGSGIKVRVTNLLGLPAGSLESDLETLKLNVKARPHYSIAYPLHLYDGTPIYRSVREGLLKGAQTEGASIYRLKKRKQIDRLYYIFPISVELHLPVQLVRILIYLPLESIYELIYSFWETYCVHFRLYPTGWQGFLRKVKISKRLPKFVRSLFAKSVDGVQL